MSDLWTTSWGDLATLLGVIVSIGGFVWAIYEAHGAKSASEAAEAAASETRDKIAHHLQTVDLERAIGLIGKIKTLHDSNRWDASGEHYQTVRAMLSDVIARCPEGMVQIRASLSESRAILSDMDDLVRGRELDSLPSDERLRLNRELNEMQSKLEELRSNSDLAIRREGRNDHN